MIAGAELVVSGSSPAKTFVPHCRSVSFTRELSLYHSHGFLAAGTDFLRATRLCGHKGLSSIDWPPHIVTHGGQIMSVALVVCHIRLPLAPLWMLLLTVDRAEVIIGTDAAVIRHWKLRGS